MTEAAPLPCVQKMLAEPGIYIGGDTNHPGIAIVIVSMDGKLTAMSVDNELAPERFLPTFVVKHGPFQP